MPFVTGQIDYLVLVLDTQLKTALLQNTVSNYITNIYFNNLLIIIITNYDYSLILKCLYVFDQLWAEFDHSFSHSVSRLFTREAHVMYKYLRRVVAPQLITDSISGLSLLCPKPA